jgi:hypothetical protein
MVSKPPEGYFAGMLHPNLRASGFVPLPLFALAGLAALFAALLLTACSSKPATVNEPCRLMKAQIEEKQELDAQVKALGKQAVKYRKEGDTASAASAEHRLLGLRENQRMLQQSLEQSSSDCSPSGLNQVPVRDPARREYLENR